MMRWGDGFSKKLAARRSATRRARYLIDAQWLVFAAEYQSDRSPPCTTRGFDVHSEIPVRRFWHKSLMRYETSVQYHSF
jgi:hypothetical protein